MTKRLATLLFTLLSTTTLLFAQNTPYLSEIKSLKNEKWWGLFVGQDMPTPFIRPFSVNTIDRSDTGFCVSTLVSSGGRYIFSAHPMRVSFDGTDLHIESDFEKVDVVKAGRTLREAYLVCCHKHFQPDGTTPDITLLTAPVYDLRSITGTIPDQETILDIAERIEQENLPVGTLLIPFGWQSVHSSWEFDRALYPSPQETFTRLREHGFRVMLTITPYIAATGRNYIDHKRNDQLITDIEGKPITFETESGLCVCLDLTDSELAMQVCNDIANLRTEYGIDGLLLECGAIYSVLPDDPDRRHRFAANWIQAGRDYGMVICSSMPDTASFSKINLFEPHHQTLSWEHLCTAVRDMPEAGLSGYIHTLISPGIPNTGESCDEWLTTRAVQVAAFMPVALVRALPWNVTHTDCNKAIREAIILRSTLTDYLTELTDETSRTAEPLIRHMEYQFPRDGFSNCDDQFMLGSRYLVAPLLGDSSHRTVRLPRGTWLAPDGKRYKGPRVINYDAGQTGVIYFIRQK